MFDSHLHLYQYESEKLDRLIDEWKEAGIDGVVAVSNDLASSYQTLELKQKYPDFIYTAVGHHPEQPLPNEADANELLALIKCECEQIAAIGEVGLPHYALGDLDADAMEKSKHLLASFISTASRLNLPLALHAVHDKTAPVLNMLLEHKIERAHFHWLKSDEATLQKVFDSGYFVSLTPEVCYRERDQKLAQRVPLEQLLIETDGPWPFSGPFQGKPTTPLFLKNVAGKITELRGLTETTVIEHTIKNTKKVYGKR